MPEDPQEQHKRDQNDPGIPGRSRENENEPGGERKGSRSASVTDAQRELEKEVEPARGTPDES